MAGKNKLTARKVAAINEPGRYGDGDGLYLQVSKWGTKSWLYRFTLHGKSREMGLGPVADVSLAQAREKAGEARKLQREGKDPLEARKADERAAELEAARVVSFKDAAGRYINAQRPSWRNAKHASQWENTLRDYAFPVFGKVPVADVDTGLVMKALEPIWTAKPETASRVRQRIEAVLDWARVMGFRDGPNPALWRGHLSHMLPSPKKVAQVKHHAALPWQDVGDFMASLRTRPATAARAFEFCILTAARTSEALEVTWDEVDLEAAVWTVPAGRMKAQREHRVPLSPQAVAVLRHMKANHGDEGYIFPGQGKGKPLSNMAFLMLLRRMGHGDLTAHGFRSTFRDWAAEATGFPNEVAEAALAHVIGDKVEAAYRRGDLFTKRRRLMDAWAAYCDKPSAKGDNVTAINRAG